LLLNLLSCLFQNELNQQFSVYGFFDQVLSFIFSCFYRFFTEYAIKQTVIESVGI